MFNGFDRSTVALVKRREFPLRRPHMAQKADSTDLVTFKELLIAAAELGISQEVLRGKILEHNLGGVILLKERLNSGNGFNLEQFLGDIEAKIIIEALNKTGNNKNAAADLLGMTFRSLRYRIGRHKIPGDLDKPKTDYLSLYKIESLDEFMKGIEKEAIFEALKQTNGNKSEAADVLGISFRSMRYRCEQHVIG
jgi:DNA-binding NtrC family response regulator